jgi:TPR repeat protein
MALFGYGMPKDLPEGIRQLRDAADGRDPVGTHWLAWAYESGTGVPKDEAEALKLYRQAGEAGSNRARVAVARFHRYGLGGLPKSLDKAIEALQPVADDGFLTAQCDLAATFRDRFQAARTAASPAMTAEALAKHADAVASARWFREATKKNAACGELGLGYMHWFGYGVGFDFDEAIRLTDLAAKRGDQQAKDNATFIRSTWDVPTAFPGSWTVALDADRRAEIARLRGGGLLRRFGSEDVRRMRRIELECYPGATLWEAEVGPAGTSGVLAYLRAGSRVVVLDGKWPAVRDLNAGGALRIDTWTKALTYLRFAMAYSAQNDGQLVRVVTATGELPWLDSAQPFERTSTGVFVQGANLAPTAFGGWQGTVTGLYGQAILRLTIELPSDGNYTIRASDRATGGLNVRRDRFVASGLRVPGAPPAS